MVTFTEAAATEMRKRIREALEEKRRETPEDFRLSEQLALLDIAQISTLHSFCFQLVREHFHELGLDPQINVLPEESARLLAREAMDSLFEDVYAGRFELAETVQRLVSEQGRGWDKPIRDLVQRLHAYTQTLPDPSGWFQEQLDAFNESKPRLWEAWLVDELIRFQEFWKPILRAQPEGNIGAKRCLVALARFITTEPTRAEAAAVFEIILEADNQWPHGTKTRFRPAIEKIFAEVAFLNSLCKIENGIDPLAQDWDWSRGQITALLRFARQFTERYSKAKRDLAALDFQDLEQFALKLLWDTAAKKATAVAEQWRGKFRLVFVDEYQDINAAQDAILAALSREGDDANRFLVGDVKQSIYRFRLANPRIFLGYEQSWNGAVSSQVIPLSDNFRSHEAILNFVNPLFSTLMKKSIGGVDYDDKAKLCFGNRNERSALSIANDSSPRIEFHLCVTGADEAESDSEIPDALESLSSAEKEARIVGRRLLELKNQCAPIWKDGKQQPAQWSDMVILLRSPRNKSEAYAKEFARFKIPLNAARGGFYDSIEVADLLNVLRLLDNPMQDLPLLAVLRSPFAALDLDELATIRLTNRKSRFWTALVRWHEVQRNACEKLDPVSASLFQKVDRFLTIFLRWRGSIKQFSLSHLLETILDETHYCDWLVTQNRGDQRRANVARLLELTRQFDSLQGQGLFRFVRFIESQQEAEIEIEPASADSENAVRLMSIHQSKGLEFPIVVLADLGKTFNTSDLKEKIILDENFGVCPQVMPPNTRQSYPSLPYWLAQRRQKIEMLGEELRLLYVATTRAIERLILVGTASSKAFTEKWPQLAERPIGLPEISAATNFLGWLGPWIFQNVPEIANAESGETQQLRWTIYNETDQRLLISESEETKSKSPLKDETSPELLAELRARMSWRYAFSAATREPAKTSVSVLRRRAEEPDDDARPLFQLRAESIAKTGKLSAAEIGTAHHAFLEFVALNNVGEISTLKSDAERLGERGILTAEEIAALNLDAIAAFWNSPVGREILQHAGEVRREHPFTSRLNATDFVKLDFRKGVVIPSGEFLILQGVIDLAVILSGEIWLLDFKTDQIKENDLAKRTEHYRTQVALYADAMGKIYNRPVTRCWLHFLSLGKTVEIAAN